MEKGIIWYSGGLLYGLTLYVSLIKTYHCAATERTTCGYRDRVGKGLDEEEIGRRRTYHGQSHHYIACSKQKFQKCTVL